MQKIITEIPIDPLQRLEQLWSYLNAWQRSLILTRAIFFALPGFHETQWRKYAHWIGPKVHWI